MKTLYWFLPDLVLVKEPMMANAATYQGDWSLSISKQITAALVVGFIIFVASLFGILTRPIGSLAALWPANAILLGLMVRQPKLATVCGWLGAFVGYIAADLATGGKFGITLWLTLANMAGAFTGYLLFQLLSEGDKRLRRPQSVLYLFAICCAAAAAAAATGGGAARVLFGRDFVSGFEFWFVTELVNNLIILPAILTLPEHPLKNLHTFIQRTSAEWTVSTAAPLLALFASSISCVLVGGPGAIVFLVPALLWCALSYSVFTTSMMTLCFCGWLLVAISAGVVPLHTADDMLTATSSIRLGVALVALGPLAVASINAARTDLLMKLAYTADHDSLTGVLSRGAFMQRGGHLVGDPSRSPRPVALLMFDIDHFKGVNDRFGHAGGDKLLVAFSRTVADLVRPEDILARLGGEEFALVLPGACAKQAEVTAERIRTAVESIDIASARGSISATVSIGVTASSRHPSASFEELLLIADQGRYQAKMIGRNRVMAA